MGDFIHTLLTVVVFLLMFSVLVAAHELGHFLFARICKMGVSEFSIGFGKPIIKTWKRSHYKLDNGVEGETTFNFRPVPLGGFVKILGQEPQEDGSEVEVPGGFYSRPPLQRIVVLLAGPAFSILAGLIILIPALYSFGTLKESTTVAGLRDPSVALSAGMKIGDKVTAINSQPVEDGFIARATIRNSKGPVTLQLVRDGKPLTLSMTPEISKEEMDILDRDSLPTGEARRVPMLGVVFKQEMAPVTFGQATMTAIKYPIVSGQRLIANITRPKRALEESRGMIGMFSITKEAVSTGYMNVLMLSGLISISLGLFNLLPIGMLDGGQIFIAIIEMLKGGKRLSFKTQLAFLNTGMLVVLIVMLIVTGKDIARAVSPAEKGPTILREEDIKDPKKQPATEGAKNRVQVTPSGGRSSEQPR